MLLFTGQAEASIDGKSRLAIPAKYRSLLEQSGEPPIWHCMPWPEGYLRLYPTSRFLRLAEAGPDSLTPDSDRASLDVSLYSLVEQLEMDAQGRVILPRKHLAMAGLGAEVVVVGARNRLEVRDRRSWQEQEMERFRRLGQLAERWESRQSPG